MLTHGLHEGMYLRLCGREYVIQQRLPGGELHLKDVVTEDLSALTDQSLLESFARGELVFLSDKANTAKAREIEETFVADITTLAETNKAAQEMYRRHEYIRALTEMKSRPEAGAVVETPSRDEVTRIIKQVHAGVKDVKKAPHWKTVYYEWLPAYLESGEDIRSLMPNYAARGNTTHRFSGSRKKKYSEKDLELANDTATIVDEVINEHYLTLQRLSVDAVHDKLLVRLKRENLVRDKDEQLPSPSKSSLYYIVSRLDRYEVCKARHGKRIADLRFKAYMKGIITSRALERTELDGTKLDVMVIDDETGMPTGRPTFMVDFDKHTGMPTGFYVSFGGEGALAILRCLRHAILPKGYIKELYPEIKNTWDAHGLRELLVIDNGPGQHSEHLEDACLQLGTDVEYCPVKRPWFKGSVERYLRSQNQLIIHSLPGTTFSDLFDREDYDPEKHAIITLKTLLLVLHKFIVDYFQFRTRKNSNGTPWRLWKDSVKKYPPTMPQRVEELHVLLGHIAKRTIQPYGIELHGGIFYNDPALALLRRNGRISLKHKYTIKWDPLDLNAIYVLHPKTNKYLVVPSTNPAYTTGLSWYQHKVTRRFLRKREREDKDPVELAVAREEIREIVEREWKALKKTGPRSRAARYKQMSQPDYEKSQPAQKIKGVTTQSKNHSAGPKATIGPRSTQAAGISAFESAFESKSGSKRESISNVTEVSASTKKRKRKSERASSSNSKHSSTICTKQESVGRNINVNQPDDDGDLDIQAWRTDQLTKREGL